MSNRVTIADVARQAGVSPMTVSRVINHKGDVSASTRQRVLAVVEELGYRPSSIARGLATQRTGALGLVVPDVANPFFSDLVHGVEHGAYARGYNVFLCNSEEDPQRELEILDLLEEKQVEGLVLCSSRLDAQALQVLVAHQPKVVLVNRRLADRTVRSVVVDDERGGYLATRHLLDIGCRAVGLLAGPHPSRSGRLRAQGYRAALAEFQVKTREGWTRSCRPDVEGGLNAARDLLAQRPELDGLICFNDLVAVGALQACAERGLAVPEELAIVGYDDIALAALVTPSLTTCRVPRFELGRQAVRLLLEQLEGSTDAGEDIVLQPELIIRQSAPSTICHANRPTAVEEP